ncbi:GlxA family transcriptional regulator [Pseudohongiella spirulinae]|uniref:AraC family transcriptional regulator n=1 Tax=Pseudohongiella spirulinae TaxID=1249552 RepID=A0A0S2KFK4_9GAMM|nr:helix-turn-helix domain-containing protein [Pseudohongiella spirulinae]ALO46820.1 AraC family transcriptional regulator [Pseudohongiella spirulinae]
MINIAVMGFPQALASSMSIPMEMISAADTIDRLHHRRRKSQLQIRLVSECHPALQVMGGLALVTDPLPEHDPMTLVFIPALWGNPRAAVRKHPDSIRWIRQQYQQGAMLCSVGTGSYFLAEAGLLDNRQATTHWRFFDDFARHYPGVGLQRKRFITHQDRLYCTGSVNAVRDVLLHFVERLFDADTADEVAHHFTHEIKRSYESLLLATDHKDSHHDEVIIKIQEWLHANFERTVNLGELAHQFNMNPRTFNRRFRQATNQSPMQYLQTIRVNQARELLKHSNLSIAETAYAVGYQDVSHFTGLFRKLQGVTPRAYRQLVRTKQFNVNQDT